MRTFRSRTTVLGRSTALAATGAAVLALSLTACGSGSDTKAAEPAGATVAATGTKAESKAGAKSEANGETTVTVGGSHDVKAAGATVAAKPGGKRTAAAAAPVCTTKDVTISAARHGGPPYTHIVLTAKNTSGHSCKMTGFPEIQFLESHKQDVPAVAKSKPASPVVLKAGAPAYALVKISDGGVDETNEPVSAFQVTLQGGGMAAVRAPGSAGIAVDPAKALTGYWTYELRNGADDF
ncbi:DUF4232 domain-containing protein [Streptomyces venezuelae]|uniref:DUF4232 domain-containing protein n=1 Tax=Streptomyces venezuelae TaxID=54571 RepID=A0A5P2BDJ1_STRVZ|nr:DUF4232 domain-containing protein [Streptomyces venezuelae]QES28356.1 DUF4232 domain-containing protein [Streptomyces venezuelae]